MSDIEQRLRQVHPLSSQFAIGSRIFLDAAGEITRLQSEVERLRGRCGELENVIAKAKAALRKHRWCGDCYPENGWPEVNEALAFAQRLRAEAGQEQD